MKELKSKIILSKKLANKKLLDNEGVDEKLSTWISQSDNKKLVDNLLVDFDKLNAKYTQFNVDKNLQKFTKRTKKSNFKLYTLLGAAASIIVIFISSLMILNNEISNFDSEDEFVDNSIYRIKESKNKQLTLADGTQVNLDLHKQKHVVNNDSVKIKKNKSGIIYNTQKNTQPKNNTLFIPKGEKYNLTLADGTKVWLNSYTKIVYPTVFTGKTRTVYLTGEAYFEVAHNKSKPFVVKSEGMNIRVLGTKFNVNTYGDDGNYYTTLLEGKVAITSQNYSTRFLKPGQQAKLNVFFKEKLPEVKNVNSKESLNWMKNVFSFNNEPLRNILKQLERAYDVEIVYVAYFTEEFFTGEINKSDNINDILDAIELATKVRFERKGKVIYIK